MVRRDLALMLLATAATQGGAAHPQVQIEVVGEMTEEALQDFFQQQMQLIQSKSRSGAAPAAAAAAAGGKRKQQRRKR